MLANSDITKMVINDVIINVVSKKEKKRKFQRLALEKRPKVIKETNVETALKWIFHFVKNTRKPRKLPKIHYFSDKNITS
jgi:hypothetical protein